MKLKIGKRWGSMATVGVIGVAAVAGYMYWSQRASAEDYLTAKIERGQIRNTVSATGTLQAVTTVQVGSQVSGTISALYADFNSRVYKGQIVAQLDPVIFEAQVASARANLEQARANLADAQARVLAARATVDNQRAGVSGANANLAALRAQRDDAQNQLNRQEALAKSGLVPDQDLESARTTFRAAEARYNQAAAQVEQAQASEKSSIEAGLAQAEAGIKQAQAQVQQTQASLQLAEANLSNTTIMSPIDGIVVSRDVDMGQTVAASLSAPTLFTIANDLTQMQVIANIDQADIGVINQDNRINFTVDAFPGQNFTGDIRQIRLNPQNVSNVVTYNVVIDVKNPDLKLKPGMTANLTITIAERRDAIRIPNAAFRFRPADVTQEQLRDLMRGGGEDRQEGRQQAQEPGKQPGEQQGQTPAAREGRRPQGDGGGSERGPRDARRGESREGSREGGGEARREGSREGGREGGREFRREGGAQRPESGRESRREGDRAGAREGGREGSRPGEGRSPGQSRQGGGEGRPRQAETESGFSRVESAQTAALLSGQRRIIWVLGPDKKPAPRLVRVGITDGTATEMIDGELKEGEMVIVGQNVTGDSRASGSQQRAPGFGGAPGMGGRGGSGGGGGRR